MSRILVIPFIFAALLGSAIASTNEQPTASAGLVKCIQLLRNVDPIAEITEKAARSDRERFDKFKGHSFYRGLSRDGFNEKDLIANLFGDRRYDIRSWDYERLIRSKLGNHIPFEQALHETEFEISTRIEHEISKKGVLGFAEEQMLGTYRGVPLKDKRALAIPFGTENHLGPVNYVFGDLARVIKESPTGYPATAFILKVTERRARGIPIMYGGVLPEYFILSHVPAEDIEGTFVGFPTRKPIIGAEDWVDWIYLSIERRPNGAVQAMKIYKARVSGGSQKLTREITGKIVSIENGRAEWTEESSRYLQRLNKMVEFIVESMNQIPRF